MYPSLTGSKTSTLKSSEYKDEVGILTARKSPIGEG
ncbi:spermidine/putrescine ABC transporter ATP-binding protein [Bacillus sp. LB(2018)]|nr:spermidine/putrescine ABC transporter ATP-binding protein [Bacillus sp. OE]RFB22210.1 spermidine/putrescine ABC transporter ATP-binding protein [Bacillus sp. LB(2018)]RFB39260.1 spermidine/putrescine ABC transporter ATP-binding protein [Bacillus sp. dmp10]